MRPVHRKPLLCLPIAVVQKLGRHLAKPKRNKQLPLDGNGKLAVMNDHDRRQLAKVTF